MSKTSIVLIIYILGLIFGALVLGIWSAETNVLKAQIHAGGRGKAGGVKILDNIQDLTLESKEMLGKVLITHQTGPTGKEVKRLYVEES